MPSSPTSRPGIERISVRNLCVDYHGVVAVHDATLHLDAGTICALVGMNGAGKSTLFKALMGFVRPSAGSIAIDGQPLRQARRRRAVAYVPQTESVDWNFPVNVHEVVMMGRYGAMNLLRIPRPADRDAVREALERVELWPLRHRQIGALSGGPAQAGLPGPGPGPGRLGDAARRTLQRRRHPHREADDPTVPAVPPRRSHPDDRHPRPRPMSPASVTRWC